MNETATAERPRKKLKLKMLRHNCELHKRFILRNEEERRKRHKR